MPMARRQRIPTEDRKLRTKFSTVAIPYYAILDPDGKVVASTKGITKDTAEFLAFLCGFPRDPQ